MACRSCPSSSFSLHSPIQDTSCATVQGLLAQFMACIHMQHSMTLMCLSPPPLAKPERTINRMHTPEYPRTLRHTFDIFTMFYCTFRRVVSKSAHCPHLHTQHSMPGPPSSARRSVVSASVRSARTAYFAAGGGAPGRAPSASASASEAAIASSSSDRMRSPYFMKQLSYSDSTGMRSSEFKQLLNTRNSQVNSRKYAKELFTAKPCSEKLAARLPTPHTTGIYDTGTEKHLAAAPHQALLAAGAQAQRLQALCLPPRCLARLLALREFAGRPALAAPPDPSVAEEAPPPAAKQSRVCAGQQDHQTARAEGSLATTSSTAATSSKASKEACCRL